MLTILSDKQAIIPNTVVLMWSVRALSVYAPSRSQLPPVSAPEDSQQSPNSRHLPHGVPRPAATQRRYVQSAIADLTPWAFVTAATPPYTSSYLTYITFN